MKNKPNTVPVCQQPLSKEWLTAQYPEVFEGVGTLPDILHLEINNSVPPVQLPVRRIPLAIRDKLKHEIDRLVDLKVITPVDSPTDWISATVVTIKKDGSIRLCIDPKPLNKALKRNHYPHYSQSMTFCLTCLVLAASLFSMPKVGIGMSSLMSLVPLPQHLVHLGEDIGGCGCLLVCYQHQRNSNVQ